MKTKSILLLNPDLLWYFWVGGTQKGGFSPAKRNPQSTFLEQQSTRFPRGKSLLSFLNLKILNLLITPEIMAVEPFWYHFWTFNIFELFEGFYCWKHCFCFHFFFWKNHQVSEGRRRLFHQEIFELFPRGKSHLIFFKFKNS